MEAHTSGTGLVDSTKAQRGWLDPTLRAREQGTLRLLKIEHVLGDGKGGS